MPTVSVIIPTYNRAKPLQRTLDSVLAQTHEDLEAIVVDDASSDETASVMESYDDPRVTFIEHETNKGGSAARNTGIEHATGEYMAFLDSDDEWLPRKLERQVDLLERRSDEWVAAYCGVEMVSESEPGAIRKLATHLFSRRAVTEGKEGGEELVREVLSDDLHTSAGSTLIVRSDVVEAIDGFDESFARFQDSEFLIRVLQQGKLAYVNAPLVRRHESGNPSASDLEVADQHYLQTFSETVSDLEAQGYDVIGAHRYMLGKAFIGEGNLVRGARYLVRGRRPRPRQYPGLAATLFSGVQRRLG
ncbi:glycosyltransferase family 2 protein (plasmid) [Halorarum halophilum]|uniref:Glycosyltransferase family 2 protein n=1 Tax=Halorarum halophilum TaxID=2743090 RepID=A0A7D5GEE6_9EURY|nr:glycosyltransferase family 2 protein [Halobaculum halophilum]QLG29725.1 glycosyltransferase family 2 protein [Halobaculum halophilum]